MKVSLESVRNAFLAINRIKSEKCTPIWVHGITKNKLLMKPDIEGIASAEKEVMDIQGELVRYCEEHAEKDDKGKPKVVNNTYIGVSSSDTMLREIISRQDEASKKLNQLLRTEVSIDFQRIPFEEMPKPISQEDYESLMIFIDEPKI